MPGCVIDATPIAVDFWRPANAPGARLFFLTHLHQDHTEGLSSTWRLPIYTSPITALLLKSKYKLPESIIKELEVGQSYLIPLDEGSNTITVTVFDANHVPGAVMFLFQGYFGNILYCGDMRWSPEMLEDPVLQNVVSHRELDILYLDNTYSAPYCQFPSREEVKKQIFQIIDGYPDHEIKIGINTLGRERLLEEIAQRYREKILVSQEKFDQLQLLGCLDVFTTDPEQSRIHTFPKRQMQVATHKKWNEEYPTISIIPTALFVGWKNGPYSSQSENGMYVVPYSDHSSYPELMDMVSSLAPHQIYPLVKHWSKSGWWSDISAPDQTIKADMTVYRHLLSLPPPDPVIIPESVIRLMSREAPRVLHIQPRKYMLRKGLSPRSSKIRGVMHSSPRSYSLHSFSPGSAATPTSSFTLGSRRNVYNERNAAATPTSSIALGSSRNVYSERYAAATPTSSATLGSSSNIHKEKNTKQYEKCIQPARRKLLLPSEEESITSREREAELIKKRKLEKHISDRRDALIKETADFAACKVKELNAQTASRNIEDELQVMVQNSKLILESLSHLDSLL